MALSDITIYRDWAIIDGFVQVQPNKETDKSRVTPTEALLQIAGSEVVHLSLGSGKQTGSKFGQQEFLRLPGIQPSTTYSTDPVDDVSDV